MPDRPSDPFDPRFHRPRDARFDPRGNDDPGFDPRDRDSRFDPRDERPYDPRDQRYAPGYDPREERLDPRRDPRYDDDRRGGGSPPPPAAPPPRRSTGRLLAILAGLAALLLVGFLAYRMTQAGPGEDRLDENGASATDETASADERCGSQQTYDLVKRELFRRAAQVRGSDAGAFDRLGAYAAMRVTSPVVRRQDEELGTLVCSGSIALDLPPGVAVVGGRRTLTAQADYALQPAADGSGDVVTLSGADAIIVPLATLARTGTQPGVPQPQQESQPQSEPGPGVDSLGQPVGNVPPPAPSAPRPVPVPSEPPAVEAPEPPPPPARASSARPSFNCANARTRGELAVCRDDGLATLDRRMAGEFNGALRQASPGQRALLQRTRGTFLRYRDRCTSDACIAGAYNDRIREIRDIANDRWSPR